MRGGTLFSGIGAPECAAPWIDWRWCAEIEAFPSAVHAARFPSVPNLGDVTKVDWDAVEPVDVLVAGSPCQSFSVAGKRLGLDDPRGNLALVTIDVARRVRANWLVFENVPGLLSSAGGWDFGSFLGTLAEHGFDAVWRVLDAQFFGVAQRRRRLFLVASAGGRCNPAPVLLEPDSLQGNPAPRREAGQSPSPTLSARTKGGGGLGTDFDCDGGLIASTGQVSHCLNAGGMGRQDYETETLLTFGWQNSASQGDSVDEHITPTLDKSKTPAVAFDLAQITSKANRSEDADASTQEAHPGTLLRGVRSALGEEAFAQWGLGILNSLQSPEILRSALHGSELRPAAFSRSWVVHCTLSRAEDRGARVVQSMREARGEGRSSPGWEPSEQRSKQLGAYLSELSQPGPQAERFLCDLWEAAEGLGVLREALSAVQEARRPACREGQSAHSGWAVRRLTVEECEFLQGFPRGYTQVPYRNKPAADGPRYRALGNSMAVPVMEWILNRLRLVVAAAQKEAA